MRTAVVGHVEWIQFARVERVPTAGEIVHASETWEEPAGGGGVAAVQLLKLAGQCSLFTALGDDDFGYRAKDGLAALGLEVEATFRRTAQRRGFTFLDATGERTITVMGERLGPSGDDLLDWAAMADTGTVYFTAGDRAALEAARRAAVLTATTRAMAVLRGAGVRLDAVIGSARDPAEAYHPGDIDPPPGVVVLTDGSNGGRFETADGQKGSWEAEPLPGPVSDFYGSGDSFAAGFTYGLGAGMDVEAALKVGARCGAACATGRGAYERQLTAAQL
jgi:ribokinase